MEFFADLINMLDKIDSVCLNNILKKEFPSIVKKQKAFVRALYNRYKNKLELKIIETITYGLNFVFIGGTGEYYFPAIIFRTLSYKDTKNSIISLRKDLSFNDLQYEISTIIFKNISTRNGYSIENLECLYFYCKNFIEFTYSERFVHAYDYLMNKYYPIYYQDIKNWSFKQVEDKILDILLINTIPNNFFWNLGSFVVEPYAEINGEKFPVLPYWLIMNKKKPLFLIERISPGNYPNTYIKDQTVTSLTFFLSLNFLNNTDRNNHLFYFPDPFKSYETFERQNFTFLDGTGDESSIIRPPNWNLKVKSPNELSNPKENLNENENEEINNFILENLSLIIHEYNTSYLNNSFNIREIVINANKKNIFSNLLYNRLIIYNDNQKLVDIVIWIKYKKKGKNKYISHVTEIFKSIFPTGTILEYKTGNIFYLHIIKDNLKKDLDRIKEFLTLFNFEFTIYYPVENNGLLTYYLPQANYWQDNKWEFPEREINFSLDEFRNINKEILEEERKFGMKNENKKRISAFLKRMNEI